MSTTSKKSVRNSSSKIPESSIKRFTSKDDSVIARIEISDGNCLKQVVEYFRNVTTMVPLVFYRDRMDIIRANSDTTIINMASFDNTDFIVDFYVNPELFNDQNNTKKVKQKIKIIENGKVSYGEETVDEPDPRHIYIPTTETFHRQCKTIARRDGFRITIYKYSDAAIEFMKEKQKGRKVGEWIPDSYMKASKISANSAPYGEIEIGSEDVEEFDDYDFNSLQPLKKDPNQKVRLTELCSTCTSFVRHRYDDANLMVYPRGFRIQGEEGKSDQDFGWGIYKDIKVIKGKMKIVIKDNDTEYDSFGVPLDFMKALSKLQTIAGNGGVVAVRANESVMQIIMPISTVGRHKIMVVPPIEDDEDEDQKEDLNNT